MTNPSKIAIFDENPARAAILEAGLREAGYEDLLLVHDLSTLATNVSSFGAEALLIGTGSPRLPSFEAILKLVASLNRPVALFIEELPGETSRREDMDAAIAAGVGAYVVEGVRKELAKPMLDLSISRHQVVGRLKKDLEETKAKLEERKIVERAKGILMKVKGISEDEAYSSLRKTAMNENRKISDVAHSVIVASELLK